MAEWTAPRHQADVLTVLGLTSVDPLAQQIAGWFAAYDTLPVEQAALLVQLRAIMALKGRLLAARPATDAELTAIRSQRETLSSLAADTQTELNRLLRGRAPVAGVIATTAPQAPPTGYPNANAPRYRGGSPYPPATEDW